MSIIYDALKKVERSNNITSNVRLDKGSKETKIKAYLLYGLAVSFAFLIANTFFGLLNPSKDSIIGPTKPTEVNTDAVVKKQPQFEETEDVSKEPKDLLVLNGIFYSQDEGYALINNQIVKEGDNIEGLIVKRIALDEVELESEGSVIKLSTRR